MIAGLWLAWPRAQAPKSRPNVLFVTFDATRADHLGFLGGPAGATPMLDAMAARGTAFEEAITVQPLTLPSHTSLMTGLYPDHHGVRNNGTYVVPAEVHTLAERLNELGYATHAVVSSFVLDSRFGLDQGFDSYDDDLTGSATQKLFMFEEVTADLTAERAVRWFRSRPTDRPFFLWVHFFDPHADYTPPPDVAARFPGDPYTAEIAFADREFGRIIAELDDAKVLDNTLFVFSADHGEALGEHGESTHGIFVYDATARVPMLLAGPGVPVGGRVRDVVRTVDVVPTVLDLLGLPADTALDGRSLAAIWRGPDEPRTAYVESFAPRLNFGWSELRSLRTDQLKVIDAPRPEVFDLDRDHSELDNRWASRRDEPAIASLFADLATRRAADPFAKGAHTPTTMDASTREQLAALGYVWEAGSEGEGPRSDPKDRLVYWTRFQAGQDLIRQEKYEDAIASLRALLLEDADNVTAMGSLALALAKADRPDEALATYASMIAKDAARDTPYLASIRLLRDKKRFPEAEVIARKLVAAQPENTDAATALGDVLTEAGSFDGAAESYRRALALDPDAMSAAAGLGNCLNRSGKRSEARAILTAAHERDPADHGVTYNLAVVSDQDGDPTAALALYARATELDPDHAMSWNNYGTVLERLGQHADAVASIERAHKIDPRCSEASYNLGVMRLADGKVDEAIAIWRDAAATWPDAWLAIAHAELNRGDRAAALDALVHARAGGASALSTEDPLNGLVDPTRR